MVKAKREVEDAIGKGGLALNHSKSKAIAGWKLSDTEAQELLDNDIKVTQSCMLLGSPVGAIGQDMEDLANKECEEILDVLDPAFIFWQKHQKESFSYVSHAFYHLLKNSILSKISSFVERYDYRIAHKFVDLLTDKIMLMMQVILKEEEPLTNRVYSQIGVPLARGGLGLTNFKLVGLAHRLTKLVHCFDEGRSFARAAWDRVPNRKFPFGPMLEELQWLCNQLIETVGHGSPAVVQTLKAIQQFNDMGLAAKGLLLSIPGATSIGKDIKDYLYDLEFKKNRADLPEGKRFDEL